MSTTPNAPPAPQPSPDAASSADAARSFWPFLVSLASVAGLAELAYAIVGISELSIYLQKGLGLSVIVGAAFGAFYLAEAVLNSPMGTLADRFGRRPLMVIGALASFFTCMGFAFLRVPHFASGVYIAGAAVLLMRLVDGAGAAALWPAVFASVGDRVPEARRTTAMSALTVTYFAGIALGPFVGGYANEWYETLTHFPEDDPRHYMPSLLLAAALFLVTAISAYFVIPPKHKTEQVPQQAPPGGDAPGLNPLAQAAVAEPAVKSGAISGEAAAPAASGHEHGAFSLQATRQAFARFPFLMILALATFMAVGLIIPYVKLFASERFNVTETEFAKLLLLPAAIIGVLAVPVGRLADKFGKIIAVRGGMGACALALWLMVSVNHQAAVVAGGVLLGLGFLFAFPAYMAFLSDLTGPEERGGTLGAVRAAQGVGALIGTIFSSILFDKIGEDAPFYAAAALLTIAFLLSLVFIKTKMSPAAASASVSDTA